MKFPFDAVTNFIRKPSLYSSGEKEWSIIKEIATNSYSKTYLLKLVSPVEKDTYSYSYNYNSTYEGVIDESLVGIKLYKLSHIIYKDKKSYCRKLENVARTICNSYEDIFREAIVKIHDVWGDFGKNMYIIQDYYNTDWLGLIKTMKKKQFIKFIDDIKKVITNIHSQNLDIAPMIHFRYVNDKIEYKFWTFVKNKAYKEDEVIWKVIQCRIYEKFPDLIGTV